MSLEGGSDGYTKNTGRLEEPGDSYHERRVFKVSELASSPQDPCIEFYYIIGVQLSCVAREGCGQAVMPWTVYPRTTRQQLSNSVWLRYKYSETPNLKWKM